ncbi:unnamed protein product [Microthlaspi erraticum]|uniref:Aspartic peptidase DDI1-type domain-containing protein n=1 Tax=Microthlaspi erraticum TaxID=1685480 RepID=A0A6D2HB13_9BRAS|nr:unnamed protein product [Microthlaspi erraticum]
MRLLLRLGRGSKATQVSAHIMDSTMSLLSTLYRGCLASLWKTLQTPMEAMEKSMIAPTGARPTTRSSHEKLRKDVKSLNEKLDKLILAQSTMKKSILCLLKRWNQSKKGRIHNLLKCYMSNGQGGYNKGYYNYKSNPAMSYRNTDVANPQDQVYPQQQQARSSQAPQHGYGPKEQLPRPQGTFPGQADGVVDTSKKLAEINSKIENLNTRVYSLENHASSVAAATKQGQLPGKAFRTPRNSARSSSLKKAPGVQIDQPEVQAPTVAFHTSPVELAQQARSAARSSRTLARSRKVSELLEMSTHQINLLTSPTFLPKVKDQGKFTLPCTLGHIELDNALVDSGASINLISLTMAEKIGIAGALQRPTTSIMFGDATSKSPILCSRTIT